MQQKGPPHWAVLIHIKKLWVIIASPAGACPRVAANPSLQALRWACIRRGGRQGSRRAYCSARLSHGQCGLVFRRFRKMHIVLEVYRCVAVPDGVQSQAVRLLVPEGPGVAVHPRGMVFASLIPRRPLLLTAGKEEQREEYCKG